jgi:hypothetical protein
MAHESKSGWQGWALGVAVTLVGALGSYAWAGVSGATTDVQALRERVAVTETRQTAAEQQRAADLEELRRRLTRIENKLDEVLTRGAK